MPEKRTVEHVRACASGRAWRDLTTIRRKE
jgi:hypothetical protein